MRAARPLHRSRRARNKITKPTKGSKRRNKFFIALGLIIIFCLAAVFVLWKVILKETWDQSARLTIAVAHKNGDATLVILDPVSKNITKILIPADTQINAARQLGVWKVGSLYKLGLQEKLGGELLALSITKSMKLPMDEWGEQQMLSLLDGKIGGLISDITTRYNTSLSRKDRINIGLFAMSIKQSNTRSIDLAESGYLTKSVLKDGSDGFILKDLPMSLSSLFSDESMVEHKPRIALFDSTSQGIAKTLGAVIEVLGGKVFAVYDKPPADTDCVIKSKSKEISKRLVAVFDCKQEIDDSLSGFDIEMYLGERFERRF